MGLVCQLPLDESIGELCRRLVDRLPLLSRLPVRHAGEPVGEILDGRDRIDGPRKRYKRKGEVFHRVINQVNERIRPAPLYRVSIRD